MTALAVVAAVLAAVLPAATPLVQVELLAKLAPGEAVLSGPGRDVELVAGEDCLFVDGRPEREWVGAPGRWTVSIPGVEQKAYQAALTVRADSGVLHFRAVFDLEDYVAAVVASETTSGTPQEALRAQAVVARSYALAARDRHPEGVLCDLAHCQLLRGSGISRSHLAAARAATVATRGQVLVLPSGEVAVAHLHAACGGHTADPAEAFGPDGPSAAVSDPGCAPEEWRARVDGAALARVLRGVLARKDPAGAAAIPLVLQASDLRVSTGAGGWVTQVGDAEGRWRISGDAFARAADAAAGRGVVRSSRFTLSDAGQSVAFHGSGRGHGVGLCQLGAARRAAAGEGYRSILRWYFPRAKLEPSP